MLRYVFLIFLFLASNSFAGYRAAPPFSPPGYSSTACFSTSAQACTVLGWGAYVAPDGFNCRAWPSANTSNPNGWYQFGYSTCDISCPAGKERLNGQCVDVCPVGSYRLSSGECDVVCPTGQLKIKSSTGVSTCTNFTDQQLCKNSWDLYISAACAKQKEDCDKDGGTFGWVNGKPTCVPANFLANQPVCSGDFTVADNGDGTGGVVCTPSGTPPTPITPPNNSDAPPPVKGGDDPSNPNDGGNTNGDGVAGSGSETTVCKSNPALSANDPACIQTETKNNNASAGGSGCAAPPSCSGDPIMCNILKQEYENKCALNQFNPATLGKLLVSDGIAALHESKNMEDYFSDIFTDNGMTSSCPAARSLSFVNQQFSYAPMCSVMEQLRPLVIMLFSFFALRLVYNSLMGI